MPRLLPSGKIIDNIWPDHPRYMITVPVEVEPGSEEYENAIDFLTRAEVEPARRYHEEALKAKS